MLALLATPKVARMSFRVGYNAEFTVPERGTEHHFDEMIGTEQLL
jgi:hypothetical protein